MTALAMAMCTASLVIMLIGINNSLTRIANALERQNQGKR